MTYLQLFGPHGIIPLHKYSWKKDGVCPHCKREISNIHYRIGWAIPEFCPLCKEMYIPFAGKLVPIYVDPVKENKGWLEHLIHQLWESIRDRVEEYFFATTIRPSEFASCWTECRQIIVAEFVATRGSYLEPFYKRCEQCKSSRNAIINRLLFIEETKNMPGFTDEQMNELKDTIQKSRSVDEFLYTMQLVE